MPISGLSISEKMWSFYTSNQRGDCPVTSFDQIKNSSTYDTTNAEDPSKQLLDDYRTWKAEQPPRNLPDSKGATEDNLKYLRQHFQGELSLFQRIDAVDTMREMGIITEDQMMDALSLGDSKMRFLRLCDAGLVDGGVNFDAKLDKWTDYFSMSSIGWANNLSKIFELLNSSLRFSGKVDLAEEIQSALNQVTSKKAF